MVGLNNLLTEDKQCCMQNNSNKMNTQCSYISAYIILYLNVTDVHDSPSCQANQIEQMKRDLQLQYPAGKINQNISNRQVLARLSIYGASSYIVAFSDIFPLCFMAAVLGHAGPNCT